MSWQRSSRRQSSFSRPVSRVPWTSEVQGSRASSYIAIVDNALGITAPTTLRDDPLAEELTAMQDNGTKPPLTSSSTFPGTAMPLIIEPPSSNYSKTAPDFNFSRYSRPADPASAAYPESFASSSWSSQSSHQLDSWMSDVALHSPATINTSISDLPNITTPFEHYIPHSPCTTSQSSPYPPSEDMSDPFDAESARSLVANSLNHAGDHLGPSSSASNMPAAVGRDQGSIPRLNDSMDYEWANPNRQAPALRVPAGPHQCSPGNSTCSPSHSMPNSPFLKSHGFEHLQPQTQSPYYDDSESTLTQNIGSLVPYGSQHLAVPQASRRRSDPPPPRPHLFQSLLPAAPPPAQSRDRAPSQGGGGGGGGGREGVFVFRGNNGYSSNVQLQPRKKGVRTKGLSDEAKKRAHQTRVERTMCLSCKISKVKCIGDEDCCVRCASKTTDKGPRACSKAYFSHLIKAGSTNFTLQHQIYHLQSDRFGRRLITLPETFDLPKLIYQVSLLSNDWDLRVYQGDSWICDLDLNECFAYLSSLVHSLPPSVPFPDLINDKLPQCTKNMGWMRCVKTGEHQQQLNVSLGTWIKWDMLPSHLSYTLVSRHDSTQRALNLDEPVDLDTIQVAAQLFGVVHRVLELSTFESLESVLKKDDMVGPEFLQGLGQLLLLLRWRVALWKHLGTSLPCNDEVLAQREGFSKNIYQLCSCLYMYFCFNRRQRLKMENLQGYDLGGQTSTYPHTQHAVVESFPGEESIRGFEKWMKDGEKSVKESGILEYHHGCMAS